jgi:hypothetical protein
MSTKARSRLRRVYFASYRLVPRPILPEWKRQILLFIFPASFAKRFTQPRKKTGPVPAVLSAEAVEHWFMNGPVLTISPAGSWLGQGIDAPRVVERVSTAFAD